MLPMEASLPNLEENAIEVGVCRPPQLAFPIFAIPAKFDVAVGTIVVSPDISRDCTLHRMANIVDIEWVTVTPSGQVSHRVQVPWKKELDSPSRVPGSVAQRNPFSMARKSVDSPASPPQSIARGDGDAPKVGLTTGWNTSLDEGVSPPGGWPLSTSHELGPAPMRKSSWWRQEWRKQQISCALSTHPSASPTGTMPLSLVRAQ
jgi:hypothetical protein